MKTSIIVIATLLGTLTAYAGTPAPIGRGESITEPNIRVTPPAAISPPVAPARVAPSAAPVVIAPATVITPPVAVTPPLVLHTADPSTSPDCKLVKIYRPDVDRVKNEITVLFQDLAKSNAAEKIKDCDQTVGGSTFISFTPWRANFQVKFWTKDGVGAVNLPIGLTDGTGTQIVCKFDEATKTVSHAKYATQWSGSLPSDIKLEKLDSYDKIAADKGCLAARGS